MTRHRPKPILILIIPLTLCILLTGCAPLTRVQPPDFCPCKQNIKDLTQTLRRNYDNLKPIQAAGRLTYIDYDTGRQKAKETFTTNLRFYPPDHLFFQANFIAGEALRLGSNPDQFYLRIKPVLGTYWYGQRTSARACKKQLRLISPDNLLEALGAINLNADFTLSSRDGYNVLTFMDDDRKPVKKVYLNCCDYRATRIEYTDEHGSIAAAIDLSDYTNAPDGITIPTKISVETFQGPQLITRLDITFTAVKPFTPSDKVLQGKLFKRPPATGFPRVYQLTPDCNWQLIEP